MMVKWMKSLLKTSSLEPCASNRVNVYDKNYSSKVTAWALDLE